MPSGVRDDRRYSCAVAVRVRCDSWQDYLELHATNISTRGVFVVSEEVVARIGANVTVDLLLPGGASVSVPARVVHHDGEAPGMGLRCAASGDDAGGYTAREKARPGRFRGAAAPRRSVSRHRRADTRDARGAAGGCPASLEDLAARYELPPHQQLGVEPAATAAEIDEAYRRLREKYDPATFEPCSPEVVLLLETLRGFIENAYEQLKPA